MAKTFIYGVPHGFDFYEKDAEFNDYFKGFYISSRRGRRLMINRRDNGETIYSYLRYGLKEVDRQPLHSFFGMSLVVDNYQFCPNFKVLLEWFDYLFNKLVNEHNIIKVNDDGVLHYVIHKFDENSNDVNWLKENIPNILSQIQTENYDNSFISGKAGQVVNFNQPVGEKRLIETFKKYCWISVSSDILEKEDEIRADIIDDSGTIELNYDELNRKLNEFNQEIVPIAVDISKASFSDLKRMHNEVLEINTSLSKYLPIISDIDEKENFRVLENKYVSLKGSIETLLMKINGRTIQEPQIETQYCFSCKQNKPLSEFRSPESTKCIECEKRDVINDPYKTCISCGKRKPVRYFNQLGTDVCDDCVKKQRKPKPNPEPNYDDVLKVFKSKGFLGALISVILIVASTIVFLNLPNSCEEGTSTAKTDNNYLKQNQNEDGGNQLVIKEELDKLISANDFKGISDYIEGKNNASDYKSEIKKTVQDYLLSIIGKPQSSEEQVLSDLEKFFVDNISLLTFINFEQDDQTYWEKFASDYFYVWGLLNRKGKISKSEKEKGSQILSSYGDAFPAAWSSLLEAKSIANKEIIVADKDTKKSTSVKLSRIGTDGQTLMGNVIIHHGFNSDFEIDTYVELVSNDGTPIVSGQKQGSFEENPRGKGNLRLKITGNAGDYTVYKCGSIVITIKAKEKQKKFHKQSGG